MGFSRYLIASILIGGLLCACDKGGVAVENNAPMPSKQMISKTESSPSSVKTTDTSVPAPSASAIPLEVDKFREKRDMCDHFRGEDPSNAKRAAELAAEMEKTCRGTDQALAELRNKYASNSMVITALKEYEDKVE